MSLSMILDFICNLLSLIVNSDIFFPAIISIVTSLAMFFIKDIRYEKHKSIEREQKYIFSYLMATRRMIDRDRIKMLNNIDIAFCECDKVIDA